jgi:integrase
LLPLRDRVPETAKRVRQRLDAIFADAVLRGLCAGNPAAAIVRRMKQKRVGEEPHLRALHFRDVPRFLRTLRDSDRVSLPVKLAMEFAVLTAARSGEARGAMWGEIDTKQRMWIVPASRMKRHEQHRVHLSPRALEVLEQAKALRNSTKADALVFPAPNAGTELSDMALTMALRERLPTGRKRDDGEPEMYGDATTMHGLARTSFSTWANDQRIASPDVIEAALAHKETDRIRAAYDRSAKEGERFERDLRALRHAWSDYLCVARRGKVVSLHRAAGA